MVRCILRFDDFCALTSTKIESRFLETVAECGAKVMMSVVPFVADTEWELRGPIPLRPLPRDKANLLKKFVPRHAEVAMHGYSHQTVTRWSQLFEFGDSVGPQRQIDRLQDGRAFLEDLFQTKVETFVPPWNEYGRTTLAALEETGFKVLSGSAEFGSAEGNLAFMPVCCELGQLETALAVAAPDPDAVVCVVIHEYDFQESGSPRARTDLAGLRKLLTKVSRHGLMWSGFSDSVSAGDWSGTRLLKNQQLRRDMESFGCWGLHPNTGSVYWSAACAVEKQGVLVAGGKRRWLRRAVNFFRS